MITEFSPVQEINCFPSVHPHQPSTLNQGATVTPPGINRGHSLVSSIECVNSSSSPVFIRDLFHPVLVHLAFLCLLVICQCYVLPRKSGEENTFSLIMI